MKKAILLFDSECSLCSRFQKALERIDSKNLIEYKSIHDKSVYVDHPQLNEDECFEQVHLIDPENNIHRGGEVIEYIAKLLPGVSKFAWLLDNDSSKKAMDVFYTQLNDMRLMKRKKCFSCGSSTKRYK